MSTVKRWAVTYTKHLKQKRKVYHDGVLELCRSGRKVLLYDECEKLIDSKFLKNDELIECGQMITLEAHLVDIGGLEESRIPLADINVTDLKSTERNGAGPQKERKKSMLHRRLPHNRSNAANKTAGATQKMQLESFGKPQSLQNATNTIVKEWNALYTTQITQKAKKFHDGFLRLSVCGAYMDQVTLLNEEGAVLSSKYVKCAEFIKTGKTLELPNYLVEICELKTVEGDLRKVTPEKVAYSGSSKHGRPNNGNFMSAREMIKSKQSEGPSREVAGSSSSSFGKLKNRNNMPTLDAGEMKVLFHYRVAIPSSPENLSEGPPREVTDASNTSHGEAMSTRVINNKSLRDACQILTTIRKPVPESKNVLGKLPTELVQPAQSLKDAGRSLQMGQSHSTSNFNQLDLQNQSMLLEDNLLEKKLNEPAKENFKGDTCELSAGNHIQSGSSGKSLDSSAYEDVSNSGVTSRIGANYQEPITSNASANELRVDCSEKLSEGTIASAAIYGKTNTNTISLPVLSHKTTPGISFSGEGLFWQLVSSTNDTVPLTISAVSTLVKQQFPDSSTNIFNGTIADIETSATSGMKGDILPCVGNQKNDKFAQTPATNTKEREICGSALVASGPACAAIDCNKKWEDSELQSLSTKCCAMQDFPTFDLGF